MRGATLARALALATVGSVVLSGCMPFGETASEQDPDVVAIVLVDVSKSTYGKRGAQRVQYRRGFDQVLTNLPAGTLLKGDVIDSNPLAHATFPISVFFEESNFATSSEVRVERQQAAAREAALDGWDEIARQRPRGNAILDALEVAQDVYASYPDAEQRFLVIFSDMLENSDRYSFERKNLVPAKVDAFIAREHNAGRVPDLREVEVYVIGAGATRGNDAKARHIRATEEFWMKYFAATGASIPPSRYGPTLVRFP